MFKPWLCIPPAWAHSLAPAATEFYSWLQTAPTPEWRPFTWNGIHFKNRLGLAGGVDKNAENTLAWQKIGCGFVEVGTVTPQPQKPNSGRIFNRSAPEQALWNKMGFPSAGADEVFYNLRSFNDEKKIPVFINIGKNRSTPNEQAAQDYCALLEKFQHQADAFVVNISSPNTSGLRDLAKAEYLGAFLAPLLTQKKNLENPRPLLLKLSPDLESDDLKRVLDAALRHEIDGFVLTNTMLSRENLAAETVKKFSHEGGVSGQPLNLLSKKSLKTAIEHLGGEKTKKLVISVGGVMTAEDVFERISLGADLVEVYTALVFSGLNFFRKVEKVAHEFTPAQQLPTKLNC
jgi:dihydroorotate dehydrogenase